MLRPMDLGDLVDTTLKVIFRCWRTLLMITLAIGVPALISNGFVQTWMGDPRRPEAGRFGQAAMKAAMYQDFADIAALGGLMALIGLFSLLFYPLANGAIAVVTSRHLLHGERIEPGEALRAALGRYWAMVGTGLLKFLFFVLAAPLLVVVGLLILAVLTVPGGLIALATFTAFSTPIVVLEGISGGYAPLKRSWQLVRGRFWRTLGIGVIYFLLTGVISGMLTFAAALPIGLFQSFGGTSPVLGWIASALQGLATMASLAISMVGLTVVYYDLRVRKEGLDLELAANAQGAPAQPEP